jgi:HEAT repeat protein
MRTSGCNRIIKTVLAVCIAWFAASPAGAVMEYYREILQSGGSNEQVVEAIYQLSYAGNITSFWNYVKYLNYEAGESEGGGSAFLVRRAAAEALGRIRDERSIPHLVERLKNEKHDAVRASIMYALGFYPKAESSAYLSEGLSSQNEEVRYRAIMSAAGLGRKELVPAIRALYAQEKDEPMRLTIAYALYTLEDDRDTNRKLFIAGLRNRDPVVRFRAADYIGRARIDSAISEVVRAIDIENRYWVRIELDYTLAILYEERRRKREAEESAVLDRIVDGATTQNVSGKEADQKKDEKKDEKSVSPKNPEKK